MFLPLLLGIAAQASDGSSVLINSFESAEDVMQISTLSANVETSTAKFTEGAQSLKATFLADDWPHVMLRPQKPWDWSNAGGLAIDVVNPNKSTVTIGIRMDDETSADGWQHSRTANISVSPGAHTVIAAFGPDPMSVGMRGLPPSRFGESYGVNGGGSFEPKHVVNAQVFMHDPAVPVTLYLDNVRTVPPVSLAGIVDRFGQFTGSDWPGKIHSDSELLASGRSEAISLRSLPSLPDRDRFGGWSAGPKLNATGFFRTEKNDGKWWLVDPDGRLFFSAGVDTMTPSEKTIVTGREKMFTWLPGSSDPLHVFQSKVSDIHSGPVKEGEGMGFYSANLFRKYGKGWNAAWKATSLQRLPSWGFNTVGNWADESFSNNGRVPYVATAWVGGNHARVRSGSDYWNAMHDPFDPLFAEDVRHALATISEKVKDDPWCVGYFVDNELSWAGNGSNGRYGLAFGALAAPSGSPAKAAFLQRLRAKYGIIASFNRAWEMNLVGWEELEKPVEIKGDLTEAQRLDASAFVKAFAVKYFQTVRDELRKVDTHHLYLGCRFAWHGPEAEEAAAQVCDVVSYNIYAPKLNPKEWDAVSRLNKPCIIGEFHMGSLDRGMFHSGLVPASSATARAALFEGYVRSVLQHPAFVGCHWFQYVDEPLTGRSYDGENYNIGLVSVTDSPYPEMVAAARRVLGAAYTSRAGIKPPVKAEPAAPIRRRRRGFARMP